MHVPETFRVKDGPLKSDESFGNNGAFMIPSPIPSRDLFIIVSDGMDWDHVSVHVIQRGEEKTPFWGEMCYVKEMFFEKEDCVVQYHPPKKNYVNNHTNTLHLWRYQKENFPQPPSILVGIKEDE